VDVPPDQQTGRLAVTWSASPGDDDVVGAVAAFAGVAPEAIRIVRACRSCGSDRHGKPQVVAPAALPAVHVSLSRSGGLTVVAVTDVGPVGIDIEARRDDADDLLAWVRAESLVKATGHGLTIDPADLDDERWTAGLDAPDGFVGAVTILTTTTPPAEITNPAAPAG
jgi:4'-phosphopantetheinyl transferase